MDVKENLAKIETEIDASVKKCPFSTTSRDCSNKICYNRASEKAYKAGIRHFGENRLDGFKRRKNLYQAILNYISLVLYNQGKLKIL